MRGKTILEELAERSAQVYQSLVWEDPAFEAFYVAATPIGELSGLAMGSRPAARGGGAVSLEQAAGHPLGLLVGAGAPVPAGLVRHWARPSSSSRPSTAPARPSRCRTSIASRRS